MILPEDFEKQMLELLGEEEYKEFLRALDEPCPVSIRINPKKHVENAGNAGNVGNLSPVPWCGNGYYLAERPQFIFDPLLHAGAYYVQEASSMYISDLLRKYGENGENGENPAPLTVLDLCAAPGGKTTLLISDLPENTVIVANEINHKRAWILHENVSKWVNGTSDDERVIVTNNAPKDFQRLGEEVFDLILCDAPCSGEGMFRKDPKAIEEWSVANVKMCVERQREIVSDIWDSLVPGGLFIYSTCTYNRHEDEENAEWIATEMGAELLETRKFMPHRDRGEGFFCAVLRKKGSRGVEGEFKGSSKGVQGEFKGSPRGQGFKSSRVQEFKGLRNLKVLPITPHSSSQGPYCELSRDESLRYLRGEALRLPADTPRGEVTVTYEGLPLGKVKNIGTRANNLYPKEWRIWKQLS